RPASAAGYAGKWPEGVVEGGVAVLFGQPERAVDGSFVFRRELTVIIEGPDPVGALPEGCVSRSCLVRLGCFRHSRGRSLFRWRNGGFRHPGQGDRFRLGKEARGK